MFKAAVAVSSGIVPVVPLLRASVKRVLQLTEVGVLVNVGGQDVGEGVDLRLRNLAVRPCVGESSGDAGQCGSVGCNGRSTESPETGNVGRVSGNPTIA
jgi:hypothetical protein